MTGKQISVRLNPNKKELVSNTARMKGISMNEFINNAIDMVLGIETKEKVQLTKQKEILELKLKSLDKDKEIYLTSYEKNKTMIEDKIKQINISLNNMDIEYEEKSEKDNYNKIFNIVYSGTKIDDVEDLIMDHATKYNCDADELKKKIQKEVTNKRYS